MNLKFKLFLFCYAFGLLQIMSSQAFGTQAIDAAYFEYCKGNIAKGREIAESVLKDEPSSFGAHRLLNYFLPDDIRMNVNTDLQEIDQDLQPNSDVKRLDYAFAILNARPEAYKKAEAYLNFKGKEKEVEAARLILMSSVEAAEGNRESALQFLKESFAVDPRLATLLFYFVFDEPDVIDRLGADDVLEQNLPKIKDPLEADFGKVLLQVFRGVANGGQLEEPLRNLYERCPIDAAYAALYGEVLTLKEDHEKAIPILRESIKRLVFPDLYLRGLYATSLFRAGKMSEAKKEFEAIVSSPQAVTDPQTVEMSQGHLKEIENKESSGRFMVTIGALIFFALVLLAYFFKKKAKK